MSRTLQRLALSGTILLAATVLTACASGADRAAETVDPVNPVGTWGDAAATGEPSLALAEDGSLTGTDGCNRLIGTWTAETDTVTFVDVASTRMFCEGVDTWLSALATGTVDGGTLTVLDESGAEIGTLARSSDEVPTSEPSIEPIADALFTGTWGTESAGTASGEPFIIIAADGTASGSDGCNTFGDSTWTLDGDTITFDGGFSTLMACEGVDQWLNQRATATVDADTMTFFDESGAEIGSLPRTA
ncbi:META domain-containing protein [Agromyces laixinhei]|uniref:META domain-containing protein n=1 Tax=Agromyces laixinhei TaxID=2585717 RepID=UPI00143CF88A|nr:META domain-containing protein [Agromyces laixinhei]